MNIKPVGNKLLVKKIKTDNVSNGVIHHNKGEKHGNVWFEVVALPNPNLNPWSKEIKKGDLVMCKEFDYDAGVNPDHDEDFAVVDIESEHSTRPGQVLAVQSKVDDRGTIPLCTCPIDDSIKSDVSYQKHKIGCKYYNQTGTTNEIHKKVTN